jgi:hypothetical protein
MKRCPKCYEVYDNKEVFCDLDGQELLADPTLFVLDAAEASPHSGNASKTEAWWAALVGVMVGIVLCAGTYLAYDLWSFDPDLNDEKSPASASQLRDVTQVPRSETEQYSERMKDRARDISGESEGETVPQVETTPASLKHTTTTRFDQGPVTTERRFTDLNGSAGLRTIIEMNDGTAVEVDAAWKKNGGIWYRRGGVVSFVETSRVKGINFLQDASTSTETTPVP